MFFDHDYKAARDLYFGIGRPANTRAGLEALKTVSGNKENFILSVSGK